MVALDALILFNGIFAKPQMTRNRRPGKRESAYPGSNRLTCAPRRSRGSRLGLPAVRDDTGAELAILLEVTQR